MSHEKHIKIPCRVRELLSTTLGDNVMLVKFAFTPAGPDKQFQDVKNRYTYVPQNVENLERKGTCIWRRDIRLDHLCMWSTTRFLHKLKDIPVL